MTDVNQTMKPDRNGRHHSNWNSHSSEQHDHVMVSLHKSTILCSLTLKVLVCAMFRIIRQSVCFIKSQCSKYSAIIYGLLVGISDDESVES